MKYIRTKNGIYEIKGANLITKSFTIYKGKRQCFVKEKDIIDQADTIEELCDGYVIEHPINAFKFFYDKEEMLKCLFNTCMRLFKVHELKVFGCIKTDKGLIYVAKMNDKGELEWL